MKNQRASDETVQRMNVLGRDTKEKDYEIETCLTHLMTNKETSVSRTE